MIRTLLDFLFPRTCIVCGERLWRGERCMCMHCFLSIPFTHFAGEAGNPVEKLFWGRVPIVRAHSLFHYRKGFTDKILFRMKYEDAPQVGVWCGEMIANELKNGGFFEDIDMVVPLPLHWSRLLKRGYNQCDYIAKGISRVTGLPVERKVVSRSVSTSTQTKRQRMERQMNVEGIFRLVDATRIYNKHVLLVDDVITTGATACSCAHELIRAEGCRVSVVSVGYAGGNIVTTDREDYSLMSF